MTQFKENHTASASKLQADNEIIAYYEDKAIIRNEWNELFYSIIPEEFVTIGEVIPTEDIISVSSLSFTEQSKILSFIENL
jgi:hypothetical protein